VSGSLEEYSVRFAADVQETLDGVLPGVRHVVPTRFQGEERYIVRTVEKNVALHVGGEHLADLYLSFGLSLDRSGDYLKTVRTDFALKSVLDNTPLARLDYRADMNRAPVVHWNIHAERGAFSHLLARAHAVDSERVSRPHALSSLHFPVGGERFRPCLEDFLQFLVEECGVDSVTGWADVVNRGRQQWRRRQLRSTVRDAQEEAADVLRGLGWTVERTDQVDPEEYRPTFERW
jgi:hypothetical protein